MLFVQHPYIIKKVGNLFIRGFLLKIIGIKLVMYLVLHLGATADNSFLVPFATGLYIVLVYLFRLIPQIRTLRRGGSENQLIASGLC